ncbi:type IV toxin-antitoxin system AbiEi family antitoxin domain-containing protein [Paenarthrobacter sp. MSM-2-10-13]|uniref:type IV toxin-antitoxin system AbiEi family antitoxin domain-containing protein n=1 Tax=Paenarthrobacter sp. MSM-2-10-13 TaxID=2717318 RepID=UPI00141DFA0C|nr:type IV toxin-antitoxin system AbiEi family antitoxin domain-containing protein [Paenarthrobacter sp. MSM-2-10-13]NHW48851.1 type IV toxin-antitoxin system AbiEi family antitoxin domain-containing protein [Paenarthrobacter sp. MSM-2-10-13]
MVIPELILASDATRIGQDARQLAKQAKRGELVRIRRGAYIRAAYWAELNERQRHGLQAAALVNTTNTAPLFNLQTAALLWGLGVVGVPRSLCTVTGDPTGGRSKHGIRRSLGPLDTGVTQLGGFKVTDKVRTTVELAAALNFAEALALVDSSRRNQRWGDAFTADDWNKDKAWGPPAPMDELVEAASALTSVSRQRRAQSVLDLSSEKPESVGESMSRAQMILLNFPMPSLQGSFTLGNGRTARTDFWWPELGLVGEFDGHGKYLRHELRGNQTIQQAIMAEKARENGLRALGLTVVRWDWSEMMNPRAFARILNDGGLRSLRAA